MKEILNWTLDTLRSDNAMMSWLEERRYEWTPLVSDAVSHIMNGASIILVTDSERRWISQYITTTLNNPLKSRPLFPIFSIEKIFPSLDVMMANQDYDIANDMFSLAFKENYIYWYIGKSGHMNASIAKDYRSSFLWIMDEEVQNSFFLRSNDELLDLKLLHMVRLFDKTLDAVMVGDIEL